MLNPNTPPVRALQTALSLLWRYNLDPHDNFIELVGSGERAGLRFIAAFAETDTRVDVTLSRSNSLAQDIGRMVRAFVLARSRQDYDDAVKSAAARTLGDLEDLERLSPTMNPALRARARQVSARMLPPRGAQIAWEGPDAAAPKLPEELAAIVRNAENLRYAQSFERVDAAPDYEDFVRWDRPRHLLALDASWRLSTKPAQERMYLRYQYGDTGEVVLVPRGIPNFTPQMVARAWRDEAIAREKSALELDARPPIDRSSQEVANAKGRLLRNAQRILAVADAVENEIAQWNEPWNLEPEGDAIWADAPMSEERPTALLAELRQTAKQAIPPEVAQQADEGEHRIERIRARA